MSEQKRVARRLVLCLDGTWNNEDKQHVTNIVEIRNRIAPVAADGVEQRIFYHRGVGTNVFDHIRGGAFGVGLGENVRRAYRFLSQNYREKDESGATEIYIFGFSRGAYTARALAGYVGSAGLLRPEHCDEDTQNQTWTYYRTKPEDRFPAHKEAWKEKLFKDVRIRCVGVFDTVGALGIPMTWLNSLNKQRYAFHDTELGSNIDVALHALAIDEKRKPFQPAVWSKPMHNHIEQIVEQVWFAGVHANVGGGYPETGLATITLDWMISRVRALTGLDLEPVAGRDPGILAECKLHESRSLPLYVSDYAQPAFRKIANVSSQSRRVSDVGLPPRGRVHNEMIHWTALHRCAATKGEYAPRNVAAALNLLRATYGQRKSADPFVIVPLRIVGPGHEVLTAEAHGDDAWKYLHGAAAHLAPD